MAVSILLVEDDPNISRLLELYLGREFEVQRAGTAQAAAQAITAHSFDVVLLDMMLPDRPGWDLLEILRQEHTDTKIIVMTGRSDEETRRRARAMGASDVLSKPVGPSAVRRAIQALLP
jgi:DNA-binding response OmpR family regulator